MELRHRYLKPLERCPNQDLVRTLRAYFESGCNGSSAGYAVGVNRRTVSSRIETAEELMGCNVIERSAEIQAALLLDAIEAEWEY